MNQISMFKLDQLEELDMKRNIELIDVHQKLKQDKIFKVISLFSGCGGMDLGFRGDFNIFGNIYDKNPFELVFANDIIASACKTYEHKID